MLTEFLKIGAARPAFLLSCLTLGVMACSRSGDSNQADTTSAQTAETPNPDAPLLLRGTVVSASASQIVLKSDSGTVTVTLAQPFHVYTRGPSKLSQVKENSFVGVTSVKQSDGSEKAIQINVFPEELRGLGEGSRMMTPSPSTSAGSRMTNGSVSQSRMTNGTASQSRMSNGNISSTNGTSLVVQYAGGSQNVTIPPNTPVTELKVSPKALAAGDQIAVLAKKAPDGSLTTSAAVSTAK